MLINNRCWMCRIRIQDIAGKVGKVYPHPPRPKEVSEGLCRVPDPHSKADLHQPEVLVQIHIQLPQDVFETQCSE